MFTGPEYLSINLLTPKNIPPINWSINDATKRTPTAKFSTTSSRNLTCKSPIRTKQRFVPKHCVGFFIALSITGSDWFLIFADHSLEWKVLLTKLRLALVSIRLICRRSCLELIWIELRHCILVLWRVPLWWMYPGRSISLLTLLARMAKHAFQLLLSVVARRVRCQMWVCLFPESLLWSYIPCFSSAEVCRTSYPPAHPRQLVIQRALVMVFPTPDWFAVWEKLSFYLDCSDLFSIQDMLKELQHALTLLVVANDKDWHA